MLAAGSKAQAARSTRNLSGFTLLELLVVVAIIAFASAGVAFSLRDSAQAPLEREATRLAALLESARAQSRASGQTVLWVPNAQGFSFEGLPPDVLPTRWTLAGVYAQALDGRGQPVRALQLGPDPIIGAQQVLLSTDDPQVAPIHLRTDGLRPFSVLSIP